MSTTPIKRRDFIKTGAAVGGGLLVSLYLPNLTRASGSATAPGMAPTATTFVPNAFIRIAPDEKI